MKKEREQIMAYTFDYDLYSDLHKDAYGFRPRGGSFYDADTTDEQRQWLWDQAIADLEDRLAEDARREAEAVKAFEASLEESIKLGAGDRATAIRWAIQAGGFEREWDPGYICYNLGLPYHKGYEEEFLPFIRQEEAA
jgi:hypothetical protein